MNGNVVLVEDEEVVRNITSRALLRSGLKVLCFEHPRTALNFFQRRLEGDHEFGPDDVDLMISDVKMPEMNGTKLAEAVREIRPELKILFVSGYSEDVHGINKNENPFLQKPYSPNELLKRVRDLLQVEKED